MTVKTKQGTETLPAIILLDRAGNVVAVSPEWQRLVPTGIAAQQGSSLVEIASAVIGFAEWAMNSMETEREFVGAGIHLIAQKYPLPSFDSASPPQTLLTVWDAPSDGKDRASLRHNLKNRISGLKLYATFLKRKLDDQPELIDVVNKMVGSLDQMNTEVGKI